MDIVIHIPKDGPEGEIALIAHGLKRGVDVAPVADGEAGLAGGGQDRAPVTAAIKRWDRDHVLITLEAEKKRYAEVAVSAVDEAADVVMFDVKLAGESLKDQNGAHLRRLGSLLRRSLETNAGLGRALSSRILIDAQKSGATTAIGAQMCLSRAACYEAETLFSLGAMLAVLLNDLLHPDQPPSIDSPFSIAVTDGPAGSGEAEETAAPLADGACIEPEHARDTRPVVSLASEAVSVGLEVEFWVGAQAKTGEIMVLDRPLAPGVFEACRRKLLEICAEIAWPDKTRPPVRLERESKPNLSRRGRVRRRQAGPVDDRGAAAP